MHRSRAVSLATGFILLASMPAAGADRMGAPVPSAEGWIVKSFAELKSPPPPDAATALAELETAMAERGEADLARIRWWAAGGPTYRWNEIAIEEMVEGFVTLPLAARHLALLHAAMDDAVAAAWADKEIYRVTRPVADPKIEAVLPVPASPSYPSDHAAAAAAAAEILTYLFPERATRFAAQAAEAMRARVLAGVEYPSDAAAGATLGRKVAALAITRAKDDGSAAKWTGSIPEGPGKWKGTNPAGPAAATWATWVLATPDEFRPPPPPTFDSEAAKAALAELRQFQRSPRFNHRAIYWEVFGGARAHALWNDLARMKLLEYGLAFDERSSARALAALNIAFADATVACWDAKYAYWYIRPSQLDPDLKTVVPTPNHPSYPAAHGCLSTAAATVLAALFPADRDQLLARGKEAAEARIWAGIHYRFDIDAGQKLGRQVAEKVLARAFVPRIQ